MGRCGLKRDGSRVGGGDARLGERRAPQPHDLWATGDDNRPSAQHGESVGHHGAARSERRCQCRGDQPSEREQSNKCARPDRADAGAHRIRCGRLDDDGGEADDLAGSDIRLRIADHPAAVGLKSVGLIDDKLGSATTGGSAKSGYWYKVTVAGTGSTATYVAGAAPDTASVGSRVFAAATDGVIYANTASSYGVSNVPTTTSGSPIGN